MGQGGAARGGLLSNLRTAEPLTYLTTPDNHSSLAEDFRRLSWLQPCESSSLPERVASCPGTTRSPPSLFLVKERELPSPKAHEIAAKQREHHVRDGRELRL